ncbi:glycosyltransferase [Salinibacter altiplanensis]|uniref:glycosyltransferase n=1 Tax=Salinibacter altiplanensis TaxID=1803181 RepID=UPI000C9F90D2|nr:glycosyltransferase [Salinibacter altiplanensis]
MGSNKIHTTVLMSVYNGLPYLDQAIESILGQTFSEFEFLIIDDASGDGSREVLKDWAKRDRRIRLIFHDENRGLGYSLNEGVKEARGTWIARMDDDDISFPDRLERQVAYLDDHPNVDILSGWAIDCDADGKPLRLRQVPVSHGEIVRLIWTIPMIHPAVIFRREAVLEAGSYSKKLRRRQDYDLWFRCAAEGHRFDNLPEPLIYYRFTDNYYDKNDLSTAIEQVKIGWRGCRLVGAGPIAYIGVLAPLVRALLPRQLSKVLQYILQKFDPRSQKKGLSEDIRNQYLPDDLKTPNYFM